MEKKLFKIEQVIYTDVCNDSYFGKEYKTGKSFVVFDTELKVQIAVDHLNRYLHADFGDCYVNADRKLVYLTDEEVCDAYKYNGGLDENYYRYTLVETLSALDVVNACGANNVRKGEN